MLDPPPNQSLFWFFWGFVSFIQSGLFLRFFQVRLLPCIVVILDPAEHTSKFCWIIWFPLACTCLPLQLLSFSCTCAYQRNFPSCFSPISPPDTLLPGQPSSPGEILPAHSRIAPGLSPFSRAGHGPLGCLGMLQLSSDSVRLNVLFSSLVY